MNPRIPAVISKRSNMARKIAYAAKRAVFSRRAPTQPVNPIKNVMAPRIYVKYYTTEGASKGIIL